MSSETKNNRFRSAYGGLEDKPTLDHFLKHHYDPAGDVFSETFIQWVRRISAGKIVPTVLFFLGATVIAVVIAASR